MSELSKLSGRFIGKGINHEGQDFVGTFEARPVGPGHAVGFSFLAAGEDGAVYHNESSLIGKNLGGQLALWIVSTNSWGLPGGDFAERSGCTMTRG